MPALRRRTAFACLAVTALVLGAPGMGCASVQQAQRTRVAGAVLIAAGSAVILGGLVAAAEVQEPSWFDAGFERVAINLRTFPTGGALVIGGIAARLLARPHVEPGAGRRPMVAQPSPSGADLERAARYEAAIRQVVTHRQHEVCADRIDVCAHVFACLGREYESSCAVVDDLAVTRDVDLVAWERLRADIEVLRLEAYGAEAVPTGDEVTGDELRLPPAMDPLAEQGRAEPESFSEFPLFRASLPVPFAGKRWRGCPCTQRDPTPSWCFFWSPCSPHRLPAASPRARLGVPTSSGPR